MEKMEGGSLLNSEVGMRNAEICLMQEYHFDNLPIVAEIMADPSATQ
jgi:hypothetical protein